MIADPYGVLVTVMKATVKRIAVENTWLRHSLMEIDARVRAMVEQLSQLDVKVKQARKTQNAATAEMEKG